MARYAWVITRDHYAEKYNPEDNETGVMGPRSITPAQIERLERGEGITFKMRDDDKELVYTGKIIGDFDGFEPLDDFGMPNFGCTEICYPGSKLYGNGKAL